MAVALACALPAQGHAQTLEHPNVADRTYTAKWKKIEAANGAVYMVDVNSVKSYTGYMGHRRAEAIVYITEGEQFNQLNLRRFSFDCDQHYFSDMAALGQAAYAPPKSVIGIALAIACSK